MESNKQQDNMFPCDSRTSTPEYCSNYDDIKWEIGTKDEQEEYKEDDDT